MLFAALLLLIGAGMPNFINLSHQTGVGLFTAESCDFFGCRSIPLSKLVRQTIPGNSGRLISLGLFICQAIVISATVSCAVAGIAALMGKRIRALWVVMTNVAVLFLVLFNFLGSAYALSEVLDHHWKTIDDIAVTPGVSAFCLLVGAIIAIRTQFKKVERIPMPQSLVSAPVPVAPGYVVPVRTGGTVLAPSGIEAPHCPRCGRGTQWLPQEGRWFCLHDRQYVDISHSR